MTTATNKISFTGRTGLVNLTVEITRGLNRYTEETNSDGYVLTIDKADTIESTKITMFVGDKIFSGLGVSAMEAKRLNIPMALTSGTGSKMISLGISDSAVAKQITEAIAEATAEAELDSDYQTVLANRKAVADAYRSEANVENMMTLNGRTY